MCLPEACGSLHGRNGAADHPSVNEVNDSAGDGGNDATATSTTISLDIGVRSTTDNIGLVKYCGVLVAHILSSFEAARQCKQD